MTKLPTLDETERARPAPESPPQYALEHWGKVDRWTDLGRRICTMKAEARKLGVPLSEMSGASPLVDEFLALGRELQRASR